MAMPWSRRARITGLTSLAINTKSPVIAALPAPVGWKLIAVARPMDGGTSTPSAVICSARGTPNLVHTAVYLAVIAEDLCDLRGVDAEASDRPRRGRRAERRCGEGQSAVDRRRQLRRCAAAADVHVHHARGLVQQVVVERGLRDPTLLELRENRTDLALEQHEVAHQHCLGVAHLLEGDPGAERQRRLDGHPGGGDVQVTARHSNLVGPVRLKRPRLTEPRIHLFPVDGRERPRGLRALVRLLRGGLDSPFLPAYSTAAANSDERRSSEHERPNPSVHGFLSCRQRNVLRLPSDSH